LKKYAPTVNYAIDNSEEYDKVYFRIGGYFVDRKINDMNKIIGSYKVDGGKLTSTGDDLDKIGTKVNGNDKLKWNNINVNNKDHDKDAAFAIATKYNGVQLGGSIDSMVGLFGYLSEDREILDFIKKKVSKDENWRVQEVLAKSFDEYCRKIGYEEALPVIDEWLGDVDPNTRRAVTEGLRIWTSRPYFKEHPEEAIKRIAALKEDSSEYVRKSVGNALRDISKKYPELIQAELDTWNIEKKSVKQVYQLASRFIEK